MTREVKAAAEALALRIAESPEYIALRLAEENDPEKSAKAMQNYRALIRDINNTMALLLGQAPGGCAGCTGCRGAAREGTRG
ncbi:MAG: hypothetical protein IJ174_01235 [Clostridia bacterium]|nr:hypothetical protein [Clostridia bacterium]